MTSRPGWLVTTVGARGEDWGRVILVCGGPPGPVDTVLVERTATTLALARLLTRQHESLERQAHRTLISSIVAGPYADPDEVAARARALGVPVTGRQLLTAVIRSPDGGRGLPAHARVLEVADALADACRAERIPALVGSLDECRVGALLSAERRGRPGAVLTGVCAAARRAGPRAGGLRRARRRPGDRRGRARPAASGEARRSLLEAQQVADAAAGSAVGRREAAPSTGWPTCGCAACCSCSARTPGWPRSWTGNSARCSSYDAAHGTGLTKVLAAYLAEGGNKAAAAARAHLARPTLYERLRRIERILGVSLDSAESRTSLHVALLALDSAGIRPAAAGRPAG